MSDSSYNTAMNDGDFATRVLNWFDCHGRTQLPWQTDRTPYRVWISEIMLQQTQVATVIPYFTRFMARFPDIATLAGAEPEAVMAHWAGLGYYARARNLHDTAIRVMNEFGGHFPQSPDALASLPGIGRSTAGAIASLGMGLWAPILDGNVKRVLCRHAGIAGWPGEAAVSRHLWKLSEGLTPRHRPGDYNQGMMDLGATLCVKHHPECPRCPLQTDCIAYREGQTARIPGPKPAKSKPVRHCFMMVLMNANRNVWLETRPPRGIWGGLLSLPEFDSLDGLLAWNLEPRIDRDACIHWPTRRHSFTHFDLEYTPVMVTTSGQDVPPAGKEAGWHPMDDANGLPTPVRRLLQELSQSIQCGKFIHPFKQRTPT